MKAAREVMLERWGEVDGLFREVLSLPPGDRRGFLMTTCGGDRELFDTVSTLLDSVHTGPKRFEGPGEALLRAAFGDGDVPGGRTPHPSAVGPGDVVGSYRLVRELGRGGVATVFEAERADGAFERTVAVKMLRGVDTGDLVGRFVAERQILSSLDHPNIARLLDGGTTPQGQPFLVMERVDGEPITSWADRRRLTVDRRIDLFLEVAEAVQYAHVRLVVHRDIKPSNVMVGGEPGTVKLLDFGIAKLLGDGGGHAPETRAFTRWMTPRYASPEQIQGRPVTTATDVHALGVLLYELLTGQRPFGEGGGSDFELARVICEEVPRLPSSVVASAGGRGGGGAQGRGGSPPSPRTRTDPAAETRRTSPERLRRELAGDLDAIVAKALRKNPEDRFPSVQSMLEDLQRYRTGFPVQAREGMLAYRARKFLARHRFGAVASGVVLATLVGASAILAVQQRETERERDRANEAAALATQEAENAQLVIDFLADVFRGRDPSQAPADTITARDLLAWGTERVESELAVRPEVQSELYIVLGGAHFNLGLLDEGAALYRKAIRAMEAVHGSRSEEVADVLVRLAGLQGVERNHQQAVGYYEDALEIRRGLSGPDAEEVGEILVGLGSALRDLGEADSAEVLLRDAVRIGGGPTGDAKLGVTATLGLAYVLRGKGELEEAERLYESAIPLARDHSGITDTDLAIHLNNLAYLLRVRGDYDGAQALYGEALDILARLHGRGHPRSLLVASNRAGALLQMGRTEEVLALLTENVEASEAQWPEGHWRVGQAHMALGRALLRVGRAEDSREPLRKGFRIYTEVLGESHDWVQFAAATYGIAQILTGEEAEGRAALDSFYDVLRGTYEREGFVLPRDLARQVEPLLYVLRDTGLNDYAHRFQALLPSEG